MKTFSSGARSSEAAPRYDLVPLASIQRQAARMAAGAASHGPRNYLKGVDDDAFVADRKNHLIGHILAYVAGDTSDDHLGAILANAGMLAEIEAVRDSRMSNDVHETMLATSPAHLTYDERRAGQPPCACGRWFTHPEKCHAEGRCCALDHPHCGAQAGDGRS